MKLTKRQRDVLQAILAYTAKYRIAPTVRELCEMVGLSSTSAMHRHLQRLKLAGLIAWEPCKPRTIRVTEDEEHAV